MPRAHAEELSFHPKLTKAKVSLVSAPKVNQDYKTARLNKVAKPKTVPSTPVPPLDLDKLADAVAMHETGYCKSPGSPKANARNNCWGIMHWPNGKRTLKRYATIQEGKEDFKRIWGTYYKQMPNLRLARTYSGNDKAAAWLKNVTHFYETL